jgi:hypothetical protein
MMDAGQEWEALMRWFEAARSGDESALRAALEEGMWTEAREPSDGRSALMIAAEEGRLGCVGALLEEGADVEARDEWGNDALMLAAAGGRTECVKALLGAGAHARGRNRAGVGALWLAVKSANEACVELLLPWAGFEPQGSGARTATDLARSKGFEAWALRMERSASEASLGD